MKRVLRHYVLTQAPLLGGVFILWIGSLFLFLPRTSANPNAAPLTVPLAPTGLLLFSAAGNVQAERVSPDALLPTSDFGGVTADYKKELFLSPDRQLVAVTMDPIDFEGDTMTYLADIHGKQLTSAQFGRFVSWAPDSSKAILYVSTMEAPWDRYIYALDAQGKYYDTGLPNGTINADISSVDGSIVYSLTAGGTDDSNIYVRNLQGKDTLLLTGDKHVLAWVRWSPKGDKIAFMKSNLGIDNGDQSVWVMSPDGTGAEMISNVEWNYPAVWTPDGARIAFSNAGNIWEYDATTKALRNVTNMDKGNAKHPSYSADGKTIAFSSSGQAWSSDASHTVQLTNDNQLKDYPLLP